MTSEAGPAAPVPVAVLARTSTLYLQDPLSSLRRQFRSAQEWLPPGWYIAAYYWDVESGAIDIEDRSQGTSYEQFTAAGLPRDGGLADLLAEAAAPEPRFAAVVCEDIERSGRDTFNALKLERELAVRTARSLVQNLRHASSNGRPTWRSSARTSPSVSATIRS